MFCYRNLYALKNILVNIFYSPKSINIGQFVFSSSNLSLLKEPPNTVKKYMGTIVKDENHSKYTDRAGNRKCVCCHRTNEHWLSGALEID